MKMHIRAATAVLGIVHLAAAGCGCGGFRPSSQTNDAAPALVSGARVSGPVLWAHPGSLEPLYSLSVERFNANRLDQRMTLAVWPNDPYKAKMREAFGGSATSAAVPDVFFNWGGGNISNYVEQGKIADLTPLFLSNPAWADMFLPVALDPVTFRGKLYGVPMDGLQPIVFFYNREVFAKLGVVPPKTFDSLLALVAQIKTAGLVPISLEGASRWTSLMYAEYLVDRLAGPEVFQSVMAGEVTPQGNAAFQRAAAMIQQLVDAEAFEPGFYNVPFDTGAALLTSGKAAIELMGTWMVPNLIEEAPTFISSGKLGWFAFPQVPGGTGDPKNVVGNPANYYSVPEHATYKQSSLDFVRNTVMDDVYIDWLIGKGEVPPLKGIEKKLAGRPHADWLTFVHSIVAAAPSFQLSWDQALLPEQADMLLVNLDQLFRMQITPEQFAAGMTKITRERTRPLR